MLIRLLSSSPSVVSGGLVGLIVALGFQVLPDINLGGDATVFQVHEFLATIAIIFSDCVAVRLLEFFGTKI